MNVLWLATSPSLYCEEKVMGWIGSLENIIKQYCPEIKLAIAFEHSDSKFKVEKKSVTYYPINLNLKIKDVIKMKFNGNDNWYIKKPILESIIEDFKPDIIHCFGSEWNWGLIAENTSVPLVLHIQGFINIINNAAKKVYRKNNTILFKLYHPRKYLQSKFLKYYDKKRDETEFRIMKSCRFYMGRTEWDKDIVKYYSPNSKYYYCPEAIRPVIYDSLEKWLYKRRDNIKIVTISAAGHIKGNGIILETAKLLKQMGVSFEWRVSGDKNIFAEYERIHGIFAKDVNICLLGFISAEQVKCELLDAEIFVLPSIIDNSPNSLCEAQLIGTPVIASFVGGIPQMVENNRTGILYPYNEPHALAFKILNLHNSPRTQIELSKNEIEMSHRRHNPQSIARRLYDIYTDVIADKQI